VDLAVVVFLVVLVVALVDLVVVTLVVVTLVVLAVVVSLAVLAFSRSSSSSGCSREFYGSGGAVTAALYRWKTYRHSVSTNLCVCL
jgi:hypothetical protein